MRKKSHGGRDQDMWRRVLWWRKKAIECLANWDSVPKLLLKKMEREHG